MDVVESEVVEAGFRGFIEGTRFVVTQVVTSLLCGIGHGWARYAWSIYEQRRKAKEAKLKMSQNHSELTDKKGDNLLELLQEISHIATQLRCWRRADALDEAEALANLESAVDDALDSIDIAISKFKKEVGR